MKCKSEILPPYPLMQTPRRELRKLLANNLDVDELHAIRTCAINVPILRGSREGQWKLVLHQQTSI